MFQDSTSIIIISLFLMLLLVVVQAIKLVAVADFQLEFISLKIYLTKVKIYSKIVALLEISALAHFIVFANKTYYFTIISIIGFLILDFFSNKKYNKERPDYISCRVSLSEIKKEGIAKLIVSFVIAAYFLVCLIRGM